ncbi:hypothetical protein I310_05246 [Cryptococcus deuterogattii CA1014]|nr:hypothetical protein I310_05246 [Cryptococcus deuterogattii CA1014]
MFGMSPPLHPMALQSAVQSIGGQQQYGMSAYQQPMPQPTSYGGIGFGLSGVDPMGLSSQNGMSMMGMPMGDMAQPRGMGAELAGPPVGHLPAGIQSQYASSQTGHGTTTAGAGACSTASYQGNGSWGDHPANVPRARYDGAASGTGYVQADLDSPYPRAPNGSVTTAWTRYGADGSVMNGMNGPGSMGHRRLREGRV